MVSQPAYGLILIALSPLLPESARFLQQMGRLDEARATLAYFGVVAAAHPCASGPDAGERREPVGPLRPQNLLGTGIALTLAALAWGFVNFGVLLWLPSSLVAEGRSVGLASAVIARSTLIAAPTVVAAAYLCSVWSTKRALLLAIGITTLGLLAVLLRALPTLSLSLLIIGSSGVISMLLPYAAEISPIMVRGRATGWVAGWSKLGGLIAQGLSALALVPALGPASAAIAAPASVSLLLIAIFGRETRGRDLQELETGQAHLPAGRAVTTKRSDPIV